MYSFSNSNKDYCIVYGNLPSVSHTLGLTFTHKVCSSCNLTSVFSGIELVLITLLCDRNAYWRRSWGIPLKHLQYSTWMCGTAHCRQMSAALRRTNYCMSNFNPTYESASNAPKGNFLDGSASAWEIDLIFIIYNTLIVVALINTYFLRLSKNMSQCTNNFASIIKVHYFLVRRVRKESKLLPWTNNFYESRKFLSRHTCSIISLN